MAKTIIVIPENPPKTCKECHVCQPQSDGGFWCNALEWYVNDEEAGTPDRPVWCPILRETPKYRDPYEIPGDDYHKAYVDGYNKALAENCIGEYEY